MQWKPRYWKSADDLALHLRDFAGPGGDSKLPVLCLPGLTRNARDFEALAASLASERRVLCADLRGRGGSDWDPNPANYHPGTYVGDVLAMLDAFELERVVLIGTSLGGLLTMLLAGARPGAVAAAILNDIGPVIDEAGLKRIQGYVGKSSSFESWEEATRAVRETNEVALPGLDAANWEAMARRTCKEGDDGRVHFDYDPGIAQPMAGGVASASGADSWQFFEALQEIPTLVVRGEDSDILSAATLAEMQSRKPDLGICNVANRGHAPLLDETECRLAIRSFLAAHGGS